MRAVASWNGPGLPVATALADVLGLANESSVRALSGPLLVRGYLERKTLGDAGFPKPFKLTNKGREWLGLLPEPKVYALSTSKLSAPVPVLATSCGPLTEVAQEPTQWLEFLGEIFPSYHAGDQVLEAAGDSMMSAICDGDRCLLRPDVWPQINDFAYVEYRREDGMREATVKEWHYNEKTGLVTLRALNPLYKPIVRKVEDVTPRGIILDVVHRVGRK